MGVFQYYFPGHGQTKSALTREDVAKTFCRESLWDVLHTASRWAQNTVTNVLWNGAPDGGRGTLLTVQTGNEAIPGFLPGYYPAEQTWKQVDKVRVGKEFDLLPDAAARLEKDAGARDKYVAANAPWLGWYNDLARKPTPEHLLRLWPIDGPMVELGDGNQWKAPIIRTVPRRRITLPQSLSLQDDDSIETETKPEFVEFQTLSDEIWDHYWGIDGKELDDAGVLGCVIKCLNLNYRLSRTEARVLKLLDSENWRHVFRASNNFSLLEELMADNEKKESQRQQSELSAGPTESTNPVDPLLNSTSPVSVI